MSILILISFLPVAIRYDGEPAKAWFCFMWGLCAQSRSLFMSATAAAPEIRFNYLSHNDDMPEFRKALRLTEIWHSLRLMTIAAMKSSQVMTKPQIAADAFIAHAESACHPCGTCKMGYFRPMAVAPDTSVIARESLLR